MVYSLAKRQAENGHNVTVIAGKPSNIPGVKDASFVGGRPFAEKKFIINRFLTAYSLRVMIKSRKFKFDVIHNHVAEEAISFSLLAKSCFITTLHCPLTLHAFWPFVTTSISSFFPRKTKFVTVSKRSFEDYKPFYGRDLIGYIHNGIDVSNIPFNSKPDKDHEIQICFLGKLVFGKNPHLAIKIADLIHKWQYDVKLFIIGKLDFPISKYAGKLLRMAKQRKNVVLLPNASIKDVYRVLGNCDALISTSFEIGCPVSQIESLALGTPVVGFANGCAKEVVVEGLSGYLGSSLNDVAEKCLEAPRLNREECRHLAEKNFSEVKMYEKYMRVYRRSVQSLSAVN